MTCCKNVWTKFVSSLIVITCSSYAALLIMILIGSDNLTSDAREYVTKNTNLKILVYCSIVFNLLWVIISIVLPIFLTVTENQAYSIKATQKLITIYLVWIIFGFLTFIPDVISTIMHGINLFSEKSSDKDGAYFMISITSRFIILIILWITIIVTTASLQKSLSRNGSVGPYQNPLPQIQNFVPQAGQVQNPGPQVGQIVPLKPPKPVLKPSKVPYLEENNVDRVRDWYKHYENDNNNMNYNNRPDIVPKYLPRNNGNTNPAFIGNHNYGQVQPAVQPPATHMSNFLPRQHHMPGSNTNILVNGVPSGTLRRQLPWSYMPDGAELPQRQNKKPQAPVSPSEASSRSNYAPYVPPPDYTGSPNKIQRQEFNHPSWNQYL